MAEIVRIRGGNGAEYEVDLELNPSIRARIAAGELVLVAEPAAPPAKPAKMALRIFRAMREQTADRSGEEEPASAATLAQDEPEEDGAEGPSEDPEAAFDETKAKEG